MYLYIGSECYVNCVDYRDTVTCKFNVEVLNFGKYVD